MRLQLGELRERLAEQQIELKVTGEALERLSCEGYDPVYGARPLKRVIQREIETPLARLIVGGKVGLGDVVVVDVAEGRITVRASQEEHVGA